jgi:hypothetical protein
MSSHPRTDLGPAGRSVAALLALVWCIAGTLAIALGLRRGYRVASLVGVFAVVYGMMWAQVARTGRRLPWPKRHR